MNERRRNTRKKASYYIQVIDRSAEQPAGKLVDISTTGMMLSSNTPIESEKTFQLGVTLPDAFEGERPILVDAKSIWCKRNAHTSFWETGYRLHNATEDTVESINRAMNNYLFKD